MVHNYIWNVDSTIDGMLLVAAIRIRPIDSVDNVHGIYVQYQWEQVNGDYTRGFHWSESLN